MRGEEMKFVPREEERVLLLLDDWSLDSGERRGESKVEVSGVRGWGYSSGVDAPERGSEGASDEAGQGVDIGPCCARR